MKRIELWFTAFLVPLDFIAVWLSVMTARSLRFSLDILPIGESHPTPSGYDFLWWFFPVLILFMAGQKLYSLSVLRRPLNMLIRVISASLSASMILLLAVLLGRTPFIEQRNLSWFNWAGRTSLLTVIYISLAIIVSITIFRWLYQFILNLLNRFGIGRQTVLLIGNTAVAHDIVKSIAEKETNYYQLLGVVRTNGEHYHQLPIIGSLKELSDILKKYHPDQIIEADQDLAYGQILNIITMVRDQHIEFSFAPNLFEYLATNVTISLVGNTPILNLRPTPLDGWGKIVKRGMDVGISMLLLIILSPIFLILTILIKSQDGGPIFYGQERISLGNKFRMYKFRSMVVDADKLEDKLRRQANERDDGPLFKMKNDPRVTRLGRILRSSRLDELPQLYNVLRGEMSLVGPRPHLLKEINLYESHHRKVLAIKPGLSGVAQISGSSNLSFEEEVRLDTYYVENWSIFKDIEILLKTPFVVIFKDRSGC